MIKALFKGILAGLAILTFILYSSIARLLIFNPKKRLHKQQTWVKYATRILLKIFNVKVKLTNIPPARTGYLYVGNHIGFVDVLSLAAYRPSLFVTSIEMRETPLLGYLTDLGGCLYVERRNRIKILKEKDLIASTLKDGFNVVLYPEGTSTDGTKVIPFKKTLLMAAADAQATVIPFAFKIIKVNSQLPNRALADALCWYGETHFAQGLWKLLQISSAEVELEFGNELIFAPGTDREIIASTLHQEVSRIFSPLPSI